MKHFCLHNALQCVVHTNYAVFLLSYFSVPLGWSPVLQSELQHIFNLQKRTESRLRATQCFSVSVGHFVELDHFSVVGARLKGLVVLSGQCSCWLRHEGVYIISSALTDIGVIYITNKSQTVRFGLVVPVPDLTKTRPSRRHPQRVPQICDT